MSKARRPRRPRPPLGRSSLEELALTYVARFATSRAKLATYLNRKVRERGWDGEGPPPIDELVGKMADHGYVDDSAFALSKARSLSSRGYGERRVKNALWAAGIEEEDGEAAMAEAESGRAEAALRFAKRRRIGPYSSEDADRATREKWIAAMIRAGHHFDIARRICELEPGSDPDPESLEQ